MGVCSVAPGQTDLDKEKMASGFSGKIIELQINNIKTVREVTFMGSCTFPDVKLLAHRNSLNVYDVICVMICSVYGRCLNGCLACDVEGFLRF